MADDKYQWKKPWGPKPFRDAVYWLVGLIQQNEPIEGLGTDVSQTAKGKMISALSVASGGKQSCTPPDTPDTSKIYFRATHYVDGKWKCYWLDSTDCAPPP